MNIEYGSQQIPIRVLIANPLTPASSLIMMKILQGEIFGTDLMVNLTLLVYSNETERAESLKQQLAACAYSCMNIITVSSNLPRISDFDVFCFITNFANPNAIDFKKSPTTEQFDSFYLLLKIARNFSLNIPPSVDEVSERSKKKPALKHMKPIFFTDGLVPLYILYYFSKHISKDSIFCPTYIEPTAKAVLADHLKVESKAINEVQVWASNDKHVYVNVIAPCLIDDIMDQVKRKCNWTTMGRYMLEELNLDHTQFNTYWLKKDFIEKVKDINVKNPYGHICKGNGLVRFLQKIWLQRNSTTVRKMCVNSGVISDGAFGTFEGYPYVLPIKFEGDKWTADVRFENCFKTIFIQYEIARINKSVKTNYSKLIRYCEKFLVENVINQSFVQDEDDSNDFSLGWGAASMISNFS